MEATLGTLGDVHGIMGHDGLIMHVSDIDGVGVELYLTTKGDELSGGAVRVIDTDCGMLVGITHFRDYNKAVENYNLGIGAEHSAVWAPRW